MLLHPFTVPTENDLSPSAMSAGALGRHRRYRDLWRVDVRHVSLADMDQNDSHPDFDCRGWVHGGLRDVSAIMRRGVAEENCPVHCPSMSANSSSSAGPGCRTMGSPALKTIRYGMTLIPHCIVDPLAWSDHDQPVQRFSKFGGPRGPGNLETGRFGHAVQEHP